MRLILLLLLAWVALACNTTKRLATFSRTESTDTTTRIVRADSSASSERSELRTASIDRARLDELEVVVLEYDTARPIDTILGTPPLQRATTYRRRSQATQKGATASQINERDTTRLLLSDSSRTVQTIRAEATQEIEKRWSIPWWVWLIIWGCSAVVGWLWGKLRR